VAFDILALYWIGVCRRLLYIPCVASPVVTSGGIACAAAELRALKPESQQIYATAQYRQRTYLAKTRMYCA
jgi:hypothetical protein